MCPSVRPPLLTDFGLLLNEPIKEISPLLPNPCHCQDYDRAVLYPAQPGSGLRGGVWGVGCGVWGVGFRIDG